MRVEASLNAAHKFFECVPFLTSYGRPGDVLRHFKVSRLSDGPLIRGALLIIVEIGMGKFGALFIKNQGFIRGCGI